MTIFTGIVTSTKNLQTATVVVRHRTRHPLYGKAITKTKKYHVHDTFGVAVGDTVQFTPCKPISKTKRWTIVKVVGKPGAEVKEKKAEKPKTEVKKSANAKVKTQEAKVQRKAKSK